MKTIMMRKKQSQICTTQGSTASALLWRRPANGRSLASAKDRKTKTPASTAARKAIGEFIRANECRKPRKERSASIDSQRDEQRRDRRREDRKPRRSESSRSDKPRKAEADDKAKRNGAKERDVSPSKSSRSGSSRSDSSRSSE